MPLTIDDIAPAAPAAPQTAQPAAPAPAAEAETSIPESVLQIPAFSALLKGRPPAVFAAADSQLPEVKVIQQNIKPLLDNGFGVYRAKDGSGSVLFNLAFISPEEVKAADNAGKLAQIAPPVDELVGFFNQGLQGGAQPAANAPAAPTVGPNTAPPAPAAAQNRTMNARVGNLTNTSPTAGPVPGQGRLLNSILKPSI